MKLQRLVMEFLTAVSLFDAIRMMEVPRWLLIVSLADCIHIQS